MRAPVQLTDLVQISAQGRFDRRTVVWQPVKFRPEQAA
jgi:hypothetical protein